MHTNQTVKDVQKKILEIIKYIDKICRDNGIVYFIMGGTALGAVRHRGFIPWDDDLDIFMTTDQYRKFVKVFHENNSEKYILQEWRTTPEYLEYSKIRMNGTTFIEKNFKHRKDIHQGIFVDIMILHKVPDNKLLQKLVYYESKFVTLYGLSKRNWKPKTKIQIIALTLLKILPANLLNRRFYKRIYKYDGMTEHYKFCYWITPAGFKNGIFDTKFFNYPVDIPFEDTMLLGSKYIREYLEYRYGDYMKLPSKEAQKSAVHAEIFDAERDYREYIK